MSKLRELEARLIESEAALAELGRITQQAIKDENVERKRFESLKMAMDIALEIAEEVRIEKDDTFREVMSSLFTSGKTDGDFATAFAEANVSPPAELQLPAVEEKEARDDKESDEAA